MGCNCIKSIVEYTIIVPWFMTWHTNYITDENKPEALAKLYNSEYVITLDELALFH